MKQLLLALMFFSVPFVGSNARAQNFLELASLSPYTHYKTFETEHFEFIYQEGFFEFTELAAKHLEHAHTILSPILKWQPRHKTTVLIADNEDSANGFSMPPLRVGLVLIATPPDSWMSTAYSEDWIKLLVFHEYTHMLNMDATTEWMEGLRILFGDVIRPNGLWPVWMLEGLAVYYETRTSTLGRGRSPYYDSILRAYFNEGKLGTSKDFGMTLDRVNGDFPFFPSGEVPYLFGYHLWNQFAKDQNNDEKMGDYSINSSHRIPYFIEGNLQNVAGKNWIDYWNSFVTDSGTRFSAQIKKIKEDGETQPEFVTHAGYAAQGGVFSPDGLWMAYTRTSKERRQGLYLVDLKTGQEKRVTDKISGVGMSFSPDSRFLVFSALERFDTYSFYSDLFLYDVQKDKVRTLAHGARAKDPSFSPDGKKITYIEDSKASHWLKSAKIEINDHGEGTLSDIHDAYTPPAFTILGSPRFINNDEIVFSYQELGKAQADLVITSENNSGSHVLVSDGKMNRYPYPSGQNEIVYISDLDGIENIYQIGVDGNFRTKLSNVVTGANLPFTAPDGSLYASVMTSNGYEIAKLANQTSPRFKMNEVNAQPSAPASLSDALQSPELKINREDERDYSPWKSLAPRMWQPFTSTTYSSHDGFSLREDVLGFDSTGKQQYELIGGYNFKPKTVDLTLNYTFSYFRPVITLAAMSLTHDVGTGPNASQYRQTQELFAVASFPIRWTYSGLFPSVYGFMDWRTVRDLSTGENVGPSQNDFEFQKPMIPGFGGSLTFSRTEKSQLGFMPEEGTILSAVGEARTNPDEFTLYKYLLSASQYIRVGDHSVLNPVVRWLGSSRVTGFERGYALLQGKDTGNLFDRGVNSSLKRLEIRGYSDITILTKSTGVASLDYHFPIDDIFSGAHNTLPLFFRQMHGFVFAETAYTPSPRFGNLFFPSFGAGINLDTTLFIRAPVTFSFEMQNGTNKDFGGDQLFFFSLSSNGFF
jgi:Tol biopolymer transport system component